MLPRSLYILVAGMCLLAVAVVATAFGATTPAAGWSWWEAGLLLVAMLLTEANAVELTRDSDESA